MTFTKRFTSIFVALFAITTVATVTGCEATDTNYNTPAVAITTSATTTSVTTAATTTSAATESDSSNSYSDYSDPRLEYLMYVSTNPVESTTSKPVETTKPVESTTSKPVETTKPVESTTSKPVTINSLENISAICGLKSYVEQDYRICSVDVFNGHNPYDVEYYYGAAYDKYVDACDWTLVFDADYYIEQFPMLAMLYHNDKALLLEHFQTVGIHEGRQGSKNFNVGDYKKNCNSEISKTFGDNYEGYYFYYMLNYNTEKSVKTTGSSVKQYKQVLTALQATELREVNNYRAKVGAEPLKFNSEVMCMANFRAYTNAHDYYEAHDWTVINVDTMYEWMDVVNGNSIAENTVTSRNIYETAFNVYHEFYRDSPSHYSTMTKTKYDLLGVSNSYYRTGFASQFDVFINL